MRAALLGALALAATSCVSQRWSQYDASQYQVSMQPGSEAFEAHVGFLQDWSDSDEGFPPGLAAETGFYLGLLGEVEAATAWFDQELAAHPESAQFVDALRSLALGPDADDRSADGSDIESEVPE